ncbi:hypothetical protein P175DRAFT_0345926 [Aspergillus ochraceoroseus IBT 24754]|uniref:Uncharacterized protein n=1 Tax=Aspergillus ochraceoroseus IBT 24754 TaxID=1392256 RepID=A0A2T5LP07_9EURO|nr:uncharacterized protein P175DRAFT_0345926 [Aspergillus ochraceoroseus IBT 24754]PTU18020.1 hypothetical protein P175DRAFT_0345926 [Aspergillus ochraceoroseus IBT 24754]
MQFNIHNPLLANSGYSCWTFTFAGEEAPPANILDKTLSVQIPVLRQEDLEQPESESSEGASPGHTAMTNAGIAYTLQYVFYSGLPSRLLGLQWAVFARKVGVATKQSGCRQVLLHNGNVLDTAFNLVGIGIRMAQSLNLEQNPAAPGESNAQEIALSSRIWWTFDPPGCSLLPTLGEAVQDGDCFYAGLVIGCLATTPRLSRE